METNLIFTCQGCNNIIDYSSILNLSMNNQTAIGHRCKYCKDYQFLQVMREKK